MTRDDIRVIADIVGKDNIYEHFVRRINKEFQLADEQRNSNVYVLYSEEDGEQVGFIVVGHSPAKMKIWEKTFREEGWVEADFKMDDPCFELMYMYIKPEYRGKGVGKKLFQQMMDFTKGQNVGSIYAYVSDRNDEAYNFYKTMNAKIIQDLSDEGILSAFLSWEV